MISYRQIGPHLYREDAYREYCWSVDAYGALQPASFIFLCMESFNELMQENKIKLTRANERSLDTEKQVFLWKYQREAVADDSPTFGLIARIDSDDVVEIARDYLNNNNNVLLLLPNEIMALYQYTNDSLEDVKRRLERLGLSKYIKYVKPILCNKRNIWWEEVATQSGRLFISEDSFVSDAYFFDGYGKSIENTNKLITLANSFSVLEKHVIYVCIKPVISSWVCHEVITIQLQLRNHGPFIENATLCVSMDENVNALSSLEFIIDKLKPLQETTYAIQFSFRNSGVIDPIDAVNIKFQSGESANIVVESFSVSVGGSIEDITVKKAPQDSPEYLLLKETTKNVSIFRSFENVAELARLDPAACLNKLRKTAEKIAHIVLNKVCINTQTMNFNECIRAVQESNQLSSKAIGYFHTIRVIGNIASHASDTEMTEMDVRIVSYAMASLIEELLEKKMLS